MSHDEITARLRSLAEKAAQAFYDGDPAKDDLEDTILSTFAQPIADWLAADKSEASKTAMAERDLCIEEIKGLQQDMAAAEAKAYERCGDYMRERKFIAQARLDEFNLIVRERPIDPVYWDKHHRAELEGIAVVFEQWAAEKR